MRCDYLIRAMGCIDGALVDEAEDYKPARKNHAWIWAAASAACVLMIAAVILQLSGIGIDHIDTDDVYFKVCFAGYAEHGYVDYRAAAEQGKVTITDELKVQLDENKEPTVKAEDGKEATVLFSVHIYDAGGASAEYVFITCLAPLEIRYEEHEGFFESGIISLTREQILNVKCPSELSLVIAPEKLVINEEYLETAGRETLDVQVYSIAWSKIPHEELDETIGNVAEFLAEYANDYGIDRESMIEYSESSGMFRAELNTKTIAQLLADERTEMICVETDS